MVLEAYIYTSNGTELVAIVPVGVKLAANGSFIFFALVVLFISGGLGVAVAVLKTAASQSTFVSHPPNLPIGLLSDV